jgi:hypothetical protein
MAHNPGLGGAFKSFGSRHRVGGTIIQFHFFFFFFFFFF